MQRNTATRLGQLKQGDRFHYPGKKEVWQVMDTRYKVVLVNEVLGATHRFTWHVPKKKETQVIFLRHTNEPA